MKLRYKLPIYLLLLLTMLVLATAVVISYDARCEKPSAQASSDEHTKAITYNCYGASEVLNLEYLPRPIPMANEVLVKVEAASVNPLDWHYMRGSPYIMRAMIGIGRPKVHLFGTDYAGVVESVGDEVTRFKKGDLVFGAADGAFAEYVVVKENKAIAIIPSNVDFEEAAGISIAAITALQALRDKGNISAGDKVLINGASGGVGTYAVQLAKHFGAEVTGVSSARNHEMVLSIGADEMVDYKVEDVIDRASKFDLIIDNVGNFSPGQYKQILADDGTYVLVGASAGDWIAPFKNIIKMQFAKAGPEQQFVNLMAVLSQKDLGLLAEIMQSGELKTVIDRRYSLEQVPDAIDYSESGRARGKIIIDI